MLVWCWYRSVHAHAAGRTVGHCHVFRYSIAWRLVGRASIIPDPNGTAAAGAGILSRTLAAYCGQEERNAVNLNALLCRLVGHPL
jgi:hypothetical protein